VREGYTSEAAWEAGQLEQLLHAALAYHDDCGHGQPGSVAECDPVCTVAVAIRDRRAERAGLVKVQR
jgi:hypothetical protein